MSDTPCGICGESHNDEESAALCAALAASIVFAARVIEYGPWTESWCQVEVVKFTEDEGRWRAVVTILYDNGRVTRYKSAATFATQEEAATEGESLHNEWVAYCREHGANTINPIPGYGADGN